LITVTVNDNQSANNLVTQTFQVTVAPVNDAPTLNTITNVNMNEDAPLVTVSLNGISSGATNEPDTLTITAVSGAASLVPDPTPHYTNGNSTGTLTLAPLANASGTATIT